MSVKCQECPSVRISNLSIFPYISKSGILSATTKSSQDSPLLKKYKYNDLQVCKTCHMEILRVRHNMMKP